MAALIDVVNEVAIANPGGTLTMVDTSAHYSRPYANIQGIHPRIIILAAYNRIPSSSILVLIFGA
jgi:hypothetical protein